jgi:hypothetical protein
MTLRRFLLTICALASLSLTGCDVDVFGMSKLADAVNRLSNEAEVITADGGNLSRRIKEFHGDLSSLIDKAAREGNKLEEKVVLDFIEQKKEIIKDILLIEKRVFHDIHISAIEIQGRMVAVTDSLNRILDRVPKEIIAEVYAIASILPFQQSDKPLDVRGLNHVAYHPGGHYPVSFALKDAFSLGLRIANEKPIQQPVPKDSRAEFELPAESIAKFFKDEEPAKVAIELVHLKAERGQPNLKVDSGQPKRKAGGGVLDQALDNAVDKLLDRALPTVQAVLIPKDRKEGETRFIGTMNLDPLFLTAYTLVARGEDGQEQTLPIQEGPAIMDMVRLATAKLGAEGADAATIGRRHGEIFNLAKRRIPFGTSTVILPVGTKSWKFTFTPQTAPTETLQRNNPSFENITVKEDPINELTIIVRPLR